MTTLNDYGHATWTQHGVEKVRNLTREAFLKLQPLSEHSHYARHLAETYDSAIGDVCHMNSTGKGEHVMFTEGGEANTANVNGVCGGFVEDGAVEERGGIDAVSGEQLGEHEGDATGSGIEARTGRIFAEREEKGVHGAFGR